MSTTLASASAGSSGKVSYTASRPTPPRIRQPGRSQEGDCDQTRVRVRGDRPSVQHRNPPGSDDGTPQLPDGWLGGAGVDLMVVSSPFPRHADCCSQSSREVNALRNRRSHNLPITDGEHCCESDRFPGWRVGSGVVERRRAQVG
jgi:hypothetical protein